VVLDINLGAEEGRRLMQILREGAYFSRFTTTRVLVRWLRVHVHVCI